MVVLAVTDNKLTLCAASTETGVNMFNKAYTQQHAGRTVDGEDTGKFTSSM